MEKYISIDKIVHTISKTHKFDKDKLYAINTSDVLEGEIINTPLMEVAELKGQFKKTIEKGDILFSEIRPANKRYAKVNIEDTKDYVVSTKLMVLRKYNNDVDYDYFYYCLTNKWFLNILQKRAENRICSFPQITFDLLSEYKFRIPQLSEQKRIAETLSLLDQKIAINTRMNAELEAMAKQLYDYWFVQFDFPDENGKPYKSSGGKMVYNPILKREIPAGWEVGSVSDYAKIFTGKKDVSKVTPGEYLFFSCAPDPIPSNEYIYDGELVLVSGNGSYTGRVSYYNGKCDLYQRTYGCALKNEFKDCFPWFYYYMKNYFQPLYTGGKHGSAIPYIVLSDLADSIIVVNRETMHLFSNTIRSLFNYQFKNYYDTKLYLTHLRDSLLPMLMNGQVTVE